MANILVTGGAGYIGSHTCKQLAAAGHTPVVYDNLSNGHRAAVRWGPFEDGDVTDGARLREVIRTHKPQAVIHFAGLIEVGISVADPAAFYQTNVNGSLTLLQAMIGEGVGEIVFSSTAAVYGQPARVPIPEDAPTVPINPYGETKRAVEAMLGYFAALTACAMPPCDISTPPAPIRTAKWASGTIRRATWFRWSCSPRSANARTSISTAPTTPRPTAPRCATTSMSATWRGLTSPPSTIWQPRPNR